MLQVALSFYVYLITGSALAAGAMAGAYVDVAGKKILILPGAEKPLVIV